MKEETIFWAIGLLGVAFFLVFAYRLNENSKMYEEACIQSGGKAVFNGKFLECMK